MKVQELVVATSLLSALATTTLVEGQTIIQPDELYDGILNGRWGAVVDVRREDEWLQGHIENATFVPDLSVTSSFAYLIDGCQDMGCEMVVYCRSGARASVAIQRLKDELGYDNITIYNGQGTSQWTQAGYGLVFDDSVVPKCADPSFLGEKLTCEQRLADDDVADDDAFFNMTMNNATDAGDVVVDIIAEFMPNVTAAPSNVTVGGSDRQSSSSSSPSSTIVPTMTNDEEPLPAIPFSNSQQFYEGVQAGLFHVIIDVRTVAEWDEGHIEGATLIENLALEGTVPDILLNPPAHCQTSACSIAVYCRSGGRAAAAIRRLQTEFGFTKTRFYNGLGTSQWTEAGYPLVTDTGSVTPACASTTTTAEATRSGSGAGEMCASCCGLDVPSMCCELQSAYTAAPAATTTNSNGTDNDESSGSDATPTASIVPTIVATIAAVAVAVTP